MKTELTLEIIRERWSPYAFSKNNIEEFRLKAMLEAAGKAPSCFNEQPWMFVYTTREDESIFNSYLDFMEESNQAWAKNAYAIIIAMARTRFTHNGKVNRFALYDTGMAVANLSLQALAFDIYVHQMGGFFVEKVRKHFNLSDDVEPLTMIAAGYLGSGENLPPEVLRKDEVRRPRKYLNDIAFKDRLYNPGF
ncbi:MAG TPA: nitroreductase family protein [Bacteroidales bacterium]|nr:nitroreductase family protein [Bacteroidales bacterium]